MGDDHPAAAVPLESEVVEDCFRVLAHAYALYILGIGRSDDLPACETSHRYYHANSSAVGLLLLRTGTGSERVLGQPAPVVVDDQGPVVCPEDGRRRW